MFCFYLFKASSQSGPRNPDRNGKTQRGLRPPQEIPIRKLPVLLKQRNGSPGALVPRRAGRRPHAGAGLQGQSPVGPVCQGRLSPRLFSETRQAFPFHRLSFTVTFAEP